MKMKVIFLQNRIKAALWILAAVSLAGLLSVTIYVKTMDWKDLLLVAPISSISSEINAKQLEEINGEAFLLTYEILSKENLKALNANYEVTLRKTNYTYPYMLNYRHISGSFFTEKDQKEKKKSAVLNQTAAYSIFGNADACGRKVAINREYFTVIGVIEDKDDKDYKKDMNPSDKPCNVYIPAACSKENPVSFVVQISDNITEREAKNEYKSLTAPESGYVSLAFGKMAELVDGLFFIAVKLAAISIFLLILKKSGDRLWENLKQIRILSEQLYVRDLLQRYPKVVMRAAGLLILMLFNIILILNFVFGFIEYYLQWKDIKVFSQYGDLSVLGQHASSLEHVIILSIFFLIGFTMDNMLLLFLHWKKTND